jgi:2-keto-3-deoxy-L-rhamnonate aldolase RhmA
MPIILMYITNNPVVAKAAELAGVDWIFIDLEYLGKEQRQANMDTVKSRHNISDIKLVKRFLNKSSLLVRLNPININSKKEINESIDAGADILMLPYFKSYTEVNKFLEFVNGRVKTCLLLETPEAVDQIDSIIGDKRIDFIHIGLNDLHLGYHLTFMFELLSNGTVDQIIEKISTTDITYGFGGIAGLSEGELPAENIIAEHFRLKSKMAILSRSFYKQTGNENDVQSVLNIIAPKIQQIRLFEKSLEQKDSIFFANNKKIINEKVNKIIERRAEK